MLLEFNQAIRGLPSEELGSPFLFALKVLYWLKVLRRSVEPTIRFRTSIGFILVKHHRCQLPGDY